MPEIRIRIQDRTSPGKQKNIAYCEVCDKVTRLGKKFCSEHLEKGSYVQKLLAYQDDLEAERKGKKKPTITAQEVYWELKSNGPMSYARLAKDLNIPCKTIKNAVKILIKQGKVKLFTYRRGYPAVKLI